MTEEQIEQATHLLDTAAFCLEEAKNSSVSLHVAKMIRLFLAGEEACTEEHYGPESVPINPVIQKQVTEILKQRGLVS